LPGKPYILAFASDKLFKLRENILNVPFRDEYFNAGFDFLSEEVKALSKQLYNCYPVDFYQFLSEYDAGGVYFR